MGGKRKHDDPEPFPLSPKTALLPSKAYSALPDVFRNCLHSRSKKKEYQQPHSVLHQGINCVLFLKLNIMINIYFYICGVSLALYQICLSFLPLFCLPPPHTEDKMTDIGCKATTKKRSCPSFQGLLIEHGAHVP